MRFYLAGPWNCKSEMRSFRHTIEGHGWACTSSWIDFTPTPEQEKDRRVSQREAIRDLEEVAGSDVLVLVNTQLLAPIGRGGKHVEVGYAIAKQIPVYIIGNATNVFHHHPAVHVRNSVAAMMQDFG